MMNSKATANLKKTDPRSGSLYEQLGGEKAVDSLVGALYFQILNDTRIAHFFESTDIDSLRRHQKHFLSFVLGGEKVYSGRTMRRAHQHLVEQYGLDDAHFDAVVEIAAGVLRDFGYDERLVESVGQKLESVRDDVLGR